MDLHTERRSNLPLQKTRQKKDISELMGRDFFIDPRCHLAGVLFYVHDKYHAVPETC